MARDPETDGTPQSRALDALMRADGWARIYRVLLKAAIPLSRAARLEPSDLVQMALVRAYAVARRGQGESWDATQVKAFVTHMLGVMKSERWHVVTRGYVRNTVHESDRREPAADDEDGQERYVETVAHPDGDARDVLARERGLGFASRNANAVDERLNPLARLVFRALLLDPAEWDPQAFARKHGVDVKEVYRAREDVTRHTEAVMKNAPDSERDGAPASQVGAGDEDGDA